MYFDVFGPMEVTSIDSAKKFITFLDYCTHEVLAYMLSNKSKVFAEFRFLKLWLRIRLGRRLNGPINR